MTQNFFETKEIEGDKWKKGYVMDIEGLPFSIECELSFRRKLFLYPWPAKISLSHPQRSIFLLPNFFLARTMGSSSKKKLVDCDTFIFPVLKKKKFAN